MSTHVHTHKHCRWPVSPLFHMSSETTPLLQPSLAVFWNAVRDDNSISIYSLHRLLDREPLTHTSLHAAMIILLLHFKQYSNRANALQDLSARELSKSKSEFYKEVDDILRQILREYLGEPGDDIDLLLLTSFAPPPPNHDNVRGVSLHSLLSLT